MDFILRSDFIELDNLLKLLGIVSSGAEAKQLILQGGVKVNGQPETRIRRKLRAGDSVTYKDNQVSIREKA